MSYALDYIRATKKAGVKQDTRRNINLNFIKPKQYYSELLKDTFTIKDNGEISFSSGVYYSKKEVEKLNNLANEEKEKIHLLKKMFSGELVIWIYLVFR